MAALYLDNDVPQRLIPLLERDGHACTSAVDLGLATAGDEVQLLTSVQRGAIFITYNRHDFMLLHRAWHLWPPVYGEAFPPHGGILIVDQVALIEQYSALISILEAMAPEALADQMYWWHRPAGWRILSGREWRSFDLHS